jgi:excisionase family DNA binding protein
MERLLTPREAAQYMAVTPRTVKEWLRRGDLLGLKVKNMWRIRATDLEKFIQEGEDGAARHDDKKDEPTEADDGDPGVCAESIGDGVASNSAEEILSADRRRRCE